MTQDRAQPRRSVEVVEISITALHDESKHDSRKNSAAECSLYDKNAVVTSSTIPTNSEKADNPFRVIVSGGIKSVLLLLLLLNTIASKALIALVAPFFPGEAERQYGADSAMIGVIIAAYPLAMLLAAPLWSYLTPHIGRMYIYSAGVMTLALGTGLFPLAPSAAICIVLRVVQGIGNSATTTVTLAMASSLFPTNIGVVTGLLEVALGLGFFAGAPLGSILYSVGGYSTPFFTFAGILAALAVLFFATAMPQRDILNSTEQRCTSKSTVPYRHIFSMPLFLASCVIIMTAFAYSFYDPVLAPELEQQLHVTEAQMGLIFALPALPYALTAPVAGWLADRIGCKPVMVAGLFTMGVCFMLMGPAPFLEALVPELGSVPAQWAFKVTTLVIYGIGAALALIPAYPDMHKGVAHLGPAAVDRVSGLFTMAYAIGEVSGPVLGGLLYGVIGFGWESFAVGVVIFAYGAVVLALLLLGIVPKSGRFLRSSEESESLDNASIGSDASIQCK